MGVPGGNQRGTLEGTSHQVQVGPLDCSGLNYASALLAVSQIEPSGGVP